MFKIGDKVRVIDEINGHGFKMGEILSIEAVRDCDFKCSNGKDYWYLKSNEFELVGDETQSAQDKVEETTFKIGDKVRVTGENDDAKVGKHYFPVGSVGEIKAFSEAMSDYKVQVEGHFCPLWVQKSKLELVDDELKFKVGDKARIVSSLDLHGLVTGDMVEVLEVDGFNVKVQYKHYEDQWVNKCEIELIEETPFKVGDKVRVVDELNGHGFEIGEILLIKFASGCDFLCSNGKDEWHLRPNEFELIEETPFKVGDKVRVTGQNENPNVGRHPFEIGYVGEIVDDDLGEDNDLGVSDINGDGWWVEVSNLELVEEDVKSSFVADKLFPVAPKSKYTELKIIKADYGGLYIQNEEYEILFATNDLSELFDFIEGNIDV